MKETVVRINEGVYSHSPPVSLPCSANILPNVVLLANQFIAVEAKAKQRFSRWVSLIEGVEKKLRHRTVHPLAQSEHVGPVMQVVGAAGIRQGALHLFIADAFIL
jgi:hypothetical protein